MKRNLPDFIDAEVSLTLEQLCHVTHLENDFVIELVEQELIEPIGNTSEEWRFNSICLKRVSMAASFHHDLEVNLPGVALALELLNKIEELETKVRLLEQG